MRMPDILRKRYAETDKEKLCLLISILLDELKAEVALRRIAETVTDNEKAYQDGYIDGLTRAILGITTAKQLAENK